MIGLLQKVNSARVDVDGTPVAAIGPGLLVLVGVTAADGDGNADRLAERLLSYRVFPDDQGRMNLSLLDIEGEILLVPQFTLAADTRKGRRASFATAAPPDRAATLFDRLLATTRQRYGRATAGRFGADMQVSLVNDGPVTFWLEA